MSRGWERMKQTKRMDYTGGSDKSKQSLFTVVVDYRGGTYISQVEATDEADALRKWVLDLDPGPIADFGLKQKQELINSISWRDSPPTPVLDVLHVWCTSVGCGGGLMLINLIKTAR